MKTPRDRDAIVVRYLEGGPPDEMDGLLADDQAAALILLEFARLEQLCRELPIAPSEAAFRRRVRIPLLRTAAAAAVVFFLAGLLWFNRPNEAPPSGSEADRGPLSPQRVADPSEFWLPWFLQDDSSLPDFSLVSLAGPPRPSAPPIHEISLFADSFPRDSILTITPFL